MNFDGFGGLALAVVAGLWLTVFVPSWFKRSEDRERGIIAERSKSTKKRVAAPVRKPAVDNFVALAREYAATVEVSEDLEQRGWQRNELPAPRAFEGKLEVVELAEVRQLDVARAAAETVTLGQHELDEILRRRRSNG